MAYMREYYPNLHDGRWCAGSPTCKNRKLEVSIPHLHFCPPELYFNYEARREQDRSIMDEAESALRKIRPDLEVYFKDANTGKEEEVITLLVALWDDIAQERGISFTNNTPQRISQLNESKRNGISFSKNNEESISFTGREALMKNLREKIKKQGF